VLLLPASAVKDGKAWMRRVDGTEQPVDVTVGRSDSENVEVLSGLNEGDEVLKDAKK
jgi:multidrug efflux pump subunit AcrA (membrane-fusion protein)